MNFVSNCRDKIVTMNIFFLDIIPRLCAQYHCDKHVVKMVLETTQILCTTWHIADPEQKLYTPPYRMTHRNHPCTIWARTSLQNYQWLCQLGKELCTEYTYRYGKIHTCEKYIHEMSLVNPPLSLIGMTPPAQAMPILYKDSDPIDAYRGYYFFVKARMLSWKGKVNGRSPPEWICELSALFEN